MVMLFISTVLASRLLQPYLRRLEARYTDDTNKSFVFVFLLSLYTVSFTDWVPRGCGKGPTSMKRGDNEGRLSFNRSFLS